MHRSQRTGAVTWRTRRCSIVGAVVDRGAVEVGQQDPGRVGGGDAGRRPRPAPVSAGAMYGVWNAPATCSAMTRALAGGSAASFSSAGRARRRRRSGRRRCGWPGTARAPRSRRAPRRGRRRARRSCRSAPARRRRPSPGRGPPARVTAASGGEHAGERGGAELADAVAGDDARRRRSGRCSAASSAAATSSGWVRAVSLISSASAAVPRWTRSTPASADHQRSRASAPGRSSQGSRKPGFWEPWPGASTASTSTTLPDTGGSRRGRRRTKPYDRLCRVPTKIVDDRLSRLRMPGCTSCHG